MYTYHNILAASSGDPKMLLLCLFRYEQVVNIFRI